MADSNTDDARRQATTAADELAAANAALADTPPPAVPAELGGDFGPVDTGPDCGDTWDGVDWDGIPGL